MKALFLTAAIVLAAAPAASAQNYFNNSEAAVNALKGQVNNSQQMVLQQQHQSIQRQMQDPRVQAMYNQYLQQGGTMPYPQFAYQYGLTGGFTAQGKAMARETLDMNTYNERLAYNDYARSQAARGAAQGQTWSRFGDNMNEAGNLLQGSSTWTDPQTGTAYELPHATPDAPLYDPQSGRYFAMDGSGNYYISTPYGWQALTPYQ